MTVGRKTYLRILDVSRVRVYGCIIDVENQLKYLGVLLDYNHYFNAQINHMVKVTDCHLRNVAFVRECASSQLSSVSWITAALSTLVCCCMRKD